jgi:hypothetical protein
VLQETVVAKAPLLADFNKEQQEFIKSKVPDAIPRSMLFQDSDLVPNFLKRPSGQIGFA